MRGYMRSAAGTLLGTAAALVLTASPAFAAVTYTTPTGEALSTLAASNGLTAEQLASWNGLSSTSYLAAGQTVSIPAPSEVGVSTAPTTTTTTATTTTPTTTGAHTVVAGETLSSIAAASGTTADALAAANGISLDSVIVSGQTLQVPAATTSTASTTPTPTPTTTTSSAPAAGLAPISCSCGTDYLNASAASAWDAMNQASVSTYGVDLSPAGPLSAYRTYDQQAYLYNLYLSGQGAPANPPGTSPHEYGDSVDLATPEMRSIVDSLGPTYGWGKIYGPTEWWHVDYLGG